MSVAGNRSRGKGRLVVDLIVLGLTAVAAWYLWPTVLGGSSQAIVVHGRSMEPTYVTGDLIVVDTDAVPAVGNIIVFKIPSDEPGGGQLVVHRIVGIRPDGTYITKGDNKQNPDDFLTARSDILGSPRFSLPYGGQAIGLIASPIGLAAATGGLCTVLLWPRKRTPEVVIEGESASQLSLSELVAACEPAEFNESIIFSDSEMADAQAWLQSQISSHAR